MYSIVLFLMRLTAFAWAQEKSPIPGVGQSLGPLVPLVLMFAIFYFLVIRPQQKKTKAHQKFLSELKRGEMVVTNAGIVGIVRNLSDKLVTLEVDEGVCLKMLRTQISDSAASLKDEKASEEKK